MQLIISDIGRKSFPKNTYPSFKKVLSKKMIGPLSQDVWKKFSLATTSAVSAWILTSKTDKNEKNYDVDLLMQKYLQKGESYRKIADLEHILNQCKFGNGEYSTVAVNKLLESIDNKQEFVNRLIVLEELNLEKLDVDSCYSLINEFINRSRIYKDPLAVSHASAILQMIQTLCKTENKKLINFVKRLVDNEEIPLGKMQNFLFLATKNEKEFNKLYKAVMKEDYPLEFISSEGIPQELSSKRFIKDFNTIKVRMLASPQKYVNGNYKDDELAKYDIIDTLHLIGYYLPRFLDTFDKDAIDYIMRQRVNNFSSTVLKVSLLLNEELKLVKDFQKSLNQDGKPFLARQKAEIFSLIQAHKENEIPLDEIKEVLSNNRVDLSKIYKKIFYNVLRQSGFNKNEIERLSFDKLEDFDISKAHLILKNLRKDDSSALKDLIWAMFNEDFREYLHSDFAEYGEYNNITRNLFAENRLKYEKWLNPNRVQEVVFTSSIDKDLTLEKFASEIIENIEILRKTNAKNFVDKQLGNYIQEDKFVIPERFLNNKHYLINLIEKIERQLEQVWKRAQGNTLSALRNEVANSGNTLSIVSRAKTTLNVLYQIQEIKNFLNSYNPPEQIEAVFRIGMWERNPKKDIFQGNFSNCCIGMGRERGQEIADYLLNTMFNMIEIKDDKTNDIIGNALIYFVKNTQGEKRLVIDNIEINPTVKLSNDNGVQLRNAICKYAKNITKSVAGDQNIPVILGMMHNDLPCNDLKKCKEDVCFVGELSTPCVYLDAFAGLWSRFEGDFSSIYYHKL